MTDVRIPPAAEDLVAVAGSLWPAPAEASLVRGRHREPGRTVVREFAFVPNAERPRLVVPIDVPAAAAAAIRRYSQALSRSERYARAALATVLRTGVGERFLTDRVRVTVPGSAEGVDSVERLLAGIVGEPVVVSVGLGNRRANQKPILHVVTRTGRTVAFVKVGDTDATKELVRGEAAALRRIEALSMRHITPPTVLAFEEWNGLELLVLSPLVASPRHGRPADHVPYDTITELSAATGVTIGGLGDSAYWQSLHDRVALLDSQADADRLTDVIDTVANRHGPRAMHFGCWHGDFTPWNLAWDHDRVLVWDWERFATGVPLGFDLLHYRQSVRGAAGGDGNAALASLLTDPGPGLDTVGVDADVVGLTVQLYLTELCVRYLVAAQGPAGEPLRARASWLLDLLAADERTTA